MKKKFIIFLLLLGNSKVIQTNNITDQDPAGRFVVYFNRPEEKDPHTEFQVFLESIEKKIQSVGKTEEVIGECIDYILKEELPIEEALDKLFEKTSLKPNDTIQGCHPQLGGCNYSFFQLMTLASLFTDFHEQYKRILSQMLAHGADPEYHTEVKRGIECEQTSACKELEYWLAFTNRHTLKAQDILENAASPEQATMWQKDMAEAQNGFSNAKDIQELFHAFLEQKSDKTP